MQSRQNKIPNGKAQQGESKNGKQQVNSRQLRVLDYRNGKYQGFTLNDTLVKDGLGILIDDNYSFVLSEWEHNKISGPFFMLYPDQSILYGYIQKQKIGEIVCYEVNKQFNMILSKNSNTIIVDLFPSSSILVFKVDKKILDQHSVQSILRMDQSKQKDDQINTGITLMSEEHYSNADQKYKIYQRKLSISNLPQYLKSYQLFVKQKFSSESNRDELIQIVRTKQDLTVNFKKSSTTLFVKLSLHANQTRMLGSMNRHQNKYEFYRKFLHSSNTIEQCVMKAKIPLSTQYCLRPMNRPKKCKAQLLNFHRESITYINQFIDLKYMYSIKSNLEKINQLISICVTNKFAQVQLQNSRHQMNRQQNVETGPNVNYTLSEVQQEIYGAVKRKKQSTGKNLSSTSKLTQYSHHKQSAEIHPKQNGRINESYSKNNNSPYVRALHTDEDAGSSRLNRSKTYLDISSVSRNHQFKATPKKQTTKQKAQQKGTSAKKYSYLDDVENQKFDISKKAKTPVKYEGYQNMRRLTQDYEHINKQIQISLPQGKESRSPYRLDNQIYRNTSGKGNQNNAYEQKKVIDYSPISQKKVFRYLPN